MQEINISTHINFQPYFDLKQIPIPSDLDKILFYLLEDKILSKQDNGLYSITNLGAILFANQLKNFPSVGRKALRIVKYNGKNKINMEQEILLHLEQISKSFPGVKALDHVSIDIKKGEVHALVGENGAGKSTLMNIISGNYKADEGTFFWKGKEVQIESQKSAQDLGISIVYQERS